MGSEFNGQNLDGSSLPGKKTAHSDGVTDLLVLPRWKICDLDILGLGPALRSIHSGTSPLRDRSLTGILTMQPHMHQDLEMKVREEEQAGATPVALLRQRARIIFDQLAFAGGPAVH